MRKQPNPYEGCVEPWKFDLALARIRAFRLPKDRWEDSLQQLAVAIVGFRYTPNRANGAKESTALCTLINNQLRFQRRAEQREQARLTRHRDGLGLTPANADRHPLLTYEDDVPLRLDVRLATANLPPRQQAVCEGLSRGDSVRQIADALGCSWHAVRRLIAGIRAHFKQIGLDGWVHG